MVSGAGEILFEPSPCTYVPGPSLSVGLSTPSEISTTSLLFFEHGGSAAGSFFLFDLSFGPCIPDERVNADFRKDRSSSDSTYDSSSSPAYSVSFSFLPYPLF